jgi:hypothetical protein
MEVAAMPEPKHKLRILSMATPSYFPLKDLTWPGKEAYAEKWGHESVHETHSEPYALWERPKLWLKNLPRSNWMLFSACDVGITNQDIDISELIDESCDFIVCSDGNGFNADSWLLRECEESFKFLNTVMAMECRVGNEQDAMVHAMSTNLPEWRQNIRSFQNGKRPGFYPTEELMEIVRDEFNQSPLRVKIVPQRQLNAYPMKCHGGTGEEWWSWHPGDFCCHVVAKPLDYRIQAFKEILGIS